MKRGTLKFEDAQEQQYVLRLEQDQLEDEIRTLDARVEVLIAAQRSLFNKYPTLRFHRPK